MTPAMTVPAIPSEVKYAVLSAQLGELRSASRAGAGRRNRVWLVTTDRGSYVVRLLASADRLDMEARVIGVAAAAGVPVAPVLWFEASPAPLMVQPRIDGDRVSDTAPTSGLIASVARTLRMIHSIAIDHGAGNLAADLTGTCASLGDWFVHPVTIERTAVSDADGTDLALVDRSLERFESRRELLDAQPVALTHGDYSPDNLIARDGRIAGVIDWEAAKAGPPALDLGWWDWYGDVFGAPWTGDDLVDAYQPDDRVVTDELRHLVRLRVWTRELLAGLNHADRRRTDAARVSLTSELDRSS